MGNSQTNNKKYIPTNEDLVNVAYNFRDYSINQIEENNKLMTIIENLLSNVTIDNNNIEQQQNRTICFLSNKSYDYTYNISPEDQEKTIENLKITLTALKEKEKELYHKLFVNICCLEKAKNI